MFTVKEMLDGKEQVTIRYADAETIVLHYGRLTFPNGFGVGTFPLWGDSVRMSLIITFSL